MYRGGTFSRRGAPGHSAILLTAADKLIASMLMKKIASRKGGWPSKDRKDVMIRPERKLLEGVDKLAARSGASRSRLIEDWLGALVAVIGSADADADADAGNVASEFAAESVGWA